MGEPPLAALLRYKMEQERARHRQAMAAVAVGFAVIAVLFVALIWATP
jgi:flagellar biosynthesis/type III secretory pathway M-ring protein FliF/YscJ